MKFLSIPLLVFVEIDYALTQHYGFTKEKVVEQLLSFINIPYLDIEKRQILYQALLHYNTSSLDLIDCLFLSEAKLEAKTLLTFDRKLKNLEPISKP